MRLLTLNCHSWREENQLEKIKILARTIKEMQYDVIALQEVSQHKDSKIKYDNIREDNYVEILLEELRKLNENNYSYIWDFSHMGYDVYEEGLAILTKHKIIDSKAFYISKDKTIFNYKSRKIVSVTIEINNKEFDFYSCHLGWWHDEDEPFKNQVDNLICEINKEKLNFIMGDFNNNAFIRNEGYDYLLSKGLIDTYITAKSKDTGVTVSGEIDGWSKCKEKKRLDLILMNKELNVDTSNVIFNIDDYIVSDHFGVEVKLDEMLEV